MVKNFDCWEHYDEWEGWTCKICGELLESTEKVLIQHLKEKHNIKMMDDKQIFKIKMEKIQSNKEKKTLDKIFVNREKDCIKCKSNDTYLTNLRNGFNYRCNKCGEYF